MGPRLGIEELGECFEVKVGLVPPDGCFRYLSDQYGCTNWALINAVVSLFDFVFFVATTKIAFVALCTCENIRIVDRSEVGIVELAPRFPLRQ